MSRVGEIGLHERHRGRAGYCEFRRFHLTGEWQFGRDKGLKRKRVRCPRCGRRLTLRTVVDHWPGHGVLGHVIPEHKER